ncbi:MAG: ATP-binding protein, partial [Pseudomonadales bacterium]|nr:ATP-binding protein [Pseudomonadales bacterium]
DLLCQQVNRCKQILKEMVQKVEQAQSQQLSLMTPQALITQVLDKFLLLRPSITVIHNIEQSDSQFYLASDATLEQAIINLLNNAADASPHHFSITLTQSTHKIQIDIADRGIGLPPEMMALVGQKSLSTKGEQGMGIGLLLANATLARLGGEIHFVNRVGGGVTASVLLPVHSSIK